MTNSISFNHLIPKEICPSPSDVIFLFFFYPGKSAELLNQITRHLLSMDRNKLDSIENNLDLRMRPPSRDAHGNVCFADNPNLRPEFRTTFQPIDLWDYYYGEWHTPEFWDDSANKKNINLSIPAIENFWKSVQYGSQLRDTHAQKKWNHSVISIGISNTDNRILQTMDFRFIFENQNQLTGRLYLNEDFYLSNVSKLDWQYKMGEVQPLLHWCNRHLDSILTPQDIDELIRLIDCISRTRQIQKSLTN